MPDQGKTPGSAAQSARSVTTEEATGNTADSGAGAATDAAALQAREDALVDRLLGVMKSENKKGWDAIRSSTDRQFHTMRQEMQARSRPAEEYNDGSGDGQAQQAQQTPQRAPVATLDPETAEQIAINAFQNRHQDHREDWNDVVAIASDEDKSKPFRMMKVNGNGDLVVDYDRSLELIRMDVVSRLQEARIAELEGAEGAKTKDRLRRDATISGQENTEGEMPDTSKMTKDEKVKHLYKTNPEYFDEDNLPEALRGKR